MKPLQISSPKDEENQVRRFRPEELSGDFLTKEEELLIKKTNGDQLDAMVFKLLDVEGTRISVESHEKSVDLMVLEKYVHLLSPGGVESLFDRVASQVTYFINAGRERELMRMRDILFYALCQFRSKDLPDLK